MKRLRHLAQRIASKRRRLNRRLSHNLRLVWGRCRTLPHRLRLAAEVVKHGEPLKQKRSAQMRKQAKPHRARIIEALGAACFCCGESIRAALTIDHINNDGAEERRGLPDVRGQYLAILAQGCPPTRYQVLCHNCHHAKNSYGACPHRTTAARLAGLHVEQIAGAGLETLAA